MSKTNLYLGINALSTIDSSVAIGWLDLGFQLGKLHNEYNLFRHLNPRTSIDRMRNECARNAIAFDCKYLWFVDDDMILSDNTLPSLVDADADIVMARTYIRGYPFKNMSFKRENDRIVDGELRYDLTNHTDEELEGKDTVVCGAVGFACALIKVDLLRRMEPPYFITTTNSTEDIYFCLRAVQEQNAIIKVDCRVPTGHKLNSEFVNPRNVQELREYYKHFHPETKPEGRDDRGEDYFTAIEKLIHPED